MAKNDGYEGDKGEYRGWVLIAFLCAIPLLRWFSLEPAGDHFSSTYATLSTIGKAGGIAGFVLYALNFILSTRLKVLERLFGGLNRVYIAHHIVGGLALLALLFHPLFLALRLVDFRAPETFRQAAQFLLPPGLVPGDAAFVANLAQIAGMLAFTGMVTLLLITFYTRLPYQIWLFTHRFLGLAFAFATIHIVLMPSDIGSDGFFRAYMFALGAAGLGSFTYRVLLGDIFIRRSKYTLKSVVPVAKGILEVVLEPEGEALSFKPGQFVFVRFVGAEKQGIGRESHPFSITSAPGERELRLTIKMVGNFTRALADLPAGVTVEVEGAFGRFSYKRFGKREQLWIAGGIGVTPFLGMARSYDNESPPVHLVYSVAQRDELVGLPTIQDALPAKFKSFAFTPYVVKEQGAYLTAKAVKEITGDVTGKEIFICGPLPLMKGLRQQFREMGVPNSRIHSEEFALS
jgi:predicted ferric reductase